MYNAVYCGIEGVHPVPILVQLDGSGNKYIAIAWGALTGTRVENADTIISLMQNFFDVEMLLTDLPAEDSARLTDPNLEIMFWNVAETHLISRSVIVISADWTEPPGIYDLTMRRARFVAKI